MKEDARSCCGDPQSHEPREGDLTPEQREYLLELAHRSVAAAASGETLRVPATSDPTLLRPAGAFVTLHEESSRLRGCIGHIIASRPLIEAVVEMARSAATRDPRFSPVRPGEVPGLLVDISVLSPIVDVHDVEEIEVGRDGLIVEQGMRQGLLLPQVATRYNWSRERFLEETCVKAGLPRSAWLEPGTRIRRFSAEVFGDPGTENL